MAKETFYCLGVGNFCLPLTYGMSICSNKSQDFKTYLEDITQIGSYGVKQNQKIFSFKDGVNDQMLFHLSLNGGDQDQQDRILSRWHQPDIAPIVVGDMRICKAPLAKSISAYMTKKDSCANGKESVVFVFGLCQGCFSNCKVGNLDTSMVLPTTAELQFQQGDLFKNLELTLHPGLGTPSINYCQNTGKCPEEYIIWYGVVDSNDLDTSHWEKTKVASSRQFTSASPPLKKRKFSVDKSHVEDNPPFSITVLSLRPSFYVSNFDLKDMRHGNIPRDMVIVSSEGVEHECHQRLLKAESSCLSAMMTTDDYLTFATDSSWDSEFMQAFLNYLYQRVQTISFQMAVKLLKFGVSFDIPRLVRKCLVYTTKEVEKDLHLVKVEKILPKWSDYNGLLELGNFMRSLKQKKSYFIPVFARLPVLELVDSLEQILMMKKDNKLMLSRADEPLQLEAREIRSW